MSTDGQPIARQVSQSLYDRPAQGFAEFFRQNSSRESGWISVKFDNDDQWRNKFFVFEEGMLKYSDSEYSEATAIPMDNVVSFKTDMKSANPVIRISTTNRGQLTLKLANLAEMRKWTFCFQKSVALVLTHLMHNTERLSPVDGRSKQAMPSPEKGLPPRQADASGGWRGPQSLHPNAGMLSNDDVYAAFRRHEERSPGPGGGRALPGQSDRYEFRHSDGVDSPSKIPGGSTAIPIQAHSHHAAPSHGHGHGHGQQAHSHSRSRAHSSQQARSLRATSQDGYATGGSGRSESVDKMATSFKEDDDEHLRLEDLLHTPSDGSRSRADSGDHRSDESDDGDSQGDWHSKASNEMQDDDEEDLMFDLDETAESRHSMASEQQAQRQLTSSNYSNTSASRNHSNESSGPSDSFYSFGKALSLSLAMAGQDHKSPSRRSSHTSHGSAQSQSAVAHSPPNASLRSSAGSPKPGATPASQHGHTPARSAYSSMSRQNHSDYLMWESGYCSKAGIRESQEDRFACHPNINDQIRQAASSSGAGARPVQATVVLAGSASGNSSSHSNGAAAGAAGTLGGGVEGAGGYFGVYDGHGGQAAAIYLEKYLMENICLHPLFTDNLQQAVVESCIRTDKDFLVECDAKRIYCGTTALGAFVIGSSLLVFNIGDCQAVLCTAGQAVEMNDPHKPGRRDESERIQRAGGWITEERELYMYRLHRMDLSDPVVRDKANQISWVTINRVCGEISVSRSIGDPDYKRFTPGDVVTAPFSWPEKHDQIFHADLLIPDPECRLHDISPADEFLVLASDGLWDVVSPAEAVKLIRSAFEANKSPSEAAEELCEHSIKLGSADNVTIVITRFIHSTSR